MHHSEPRKTHAKVPENPSAQKMPTTCLNTPPRPSKFSPQQQPTPKHKQCPYHFGQPSHICLTCRRSICLRCAITYCQQHTIHPEGDILPLLWVDLEKLTIEPRIEDIDLRLKQSRQRQEYLIGKIENMLVQVEQNFDHLKLMLDKKKEQIVLYFKQELESKFIKEYRHYDEQLFKKLAWLRSISNDHVGRHGSIEELDQLAELIRREVPSGEAISKAQLKISKLIAGKDKIKMHSLWSEEKLQQVLYEIENIPYKIKDSNLNSSFQTSYKKKRVTTEASDTHKNQKPERATQLNSSSKNPLGNIMIKSVSNSKFPTGRKVDQH